MTHRFFIALTLPALLDVATLATAGARDESQPPLAGKKVLVELYT